MKHSLQELRISTPGRVCLFGEHQDYLHLPVIACAISRRIYIHGTRRKDYLVRIRLPDIHAEESFSLKGDLPYVRERDYFRSVVNVLRRNGCSFSQGFDCTVSGNIPINAGTSSSSALVVSWINFLSRMSDQAMILPPEKIARLAYEAEVLEFSEPGGMMDQYTTALGGVLGIASFPSVQCFPFNADIQSFVLGNSGEPKDTKHILSRVKQGVLNIVQQLQDKHPEFSLHMVSYDDVERYTSGLNNEQAELLKGTIKNRDITREATEVLNRQPLDHHKIGALLNQHQSILRQILKISTPKIDAMINSALDNGAYGAKINGSGGGGCMFAYAPENPEKVLSAVRQFGEAWIVRRDSGTQEEDMEAVG